MTAPLPLPLRPTRDAFLRITGEQPAHNLFPVSVELLADCETPVAAFQKLLAADPDPAPHAFLLESAERSDQIGRFSLLGTRPAAVFTARGRKITVAEAGRPPRVFTTDTDPLTELQRLLARYRPAPPAPGDESPFHGGAVGYLGYDAVRFFEPTVPTPDADPLGVPDAVFLVTDTHAVFDHRHRRLRLVANVLLEPGDDPGACYDLAAGKLAALAARLMAPGDLRPVQILPDAPAPAPPAVSNFPRDHYESLVVRAQEHIRAGDTFQVQVSQRFQTPFTADPLDLYRALRYVNPSPYMFILRLGNGFSVVGSSPEVHVRAKAGLVEIRPIAGTRRRGKDPAEDAALAAELQADAKERAEHLMLVDLARNDVGRLVEYNTIEVSDFMTIERYSHVMHLVTHVAGRLRPGTDAFAVLRETFPAGTVSGSPKVRSMQIIADLEGNRRGVYAGAVGYVDFNGRDLDTCIALRTVVLKDGNAYVQAAGGVVADSTPAGEWEETVNKARGVLRAVELARHFGELKPGG